MAHGMNRTSRPILEILDFVEAVTSSPFEDLIIQDPEDSSSAFPFRALLEFVEMSWESPLQDLVILRNEELCNHKNMLDKLVKERPSYLHHHIFKLQAELSKITSCLKERETELANLSSNLNQPALQNHHIPEVVDLEKDSDIKSTHKRRRTSRTVKHYGFDGVDERSTDNFAYSDRGRKTPTHSNNLSRSKISARVSPFNQPPVPVSPSSSMSAQIEHTSWAASSSSPHSSHERTLIPPPNKPRPYAPGLAMRKAKTDEYDPFSRLVPIDNYTLMKEKEDAKVLDTWTTIDPDTKTRSWDRQITEERSRLGSTEGLQRTESWSLPSSSWNAASVMSSGQGSSHGGWATSERGGNGNYPSEYSVDRRFENPTLDVDPEVRARFRGITELLQPQTSPRSAFEQRNGAVLPRNTAAPIKVIIGGNVVKTLNRKVDDRGQLRDRHGKYIDGKDRGLMKKHLEEDRKRLIGERDEQLLRATQEKRAWDAMDPDEREIRLSKKARNNFLVGMLGAGHDSSVFDVLETDEIPGIYTRKVSTRDIAGWSQQGSPRPSSGIAGVADHESYFRPFQDDEPSFSASAGTLSPQPTRSDDSGALVRSNRLETPGHTTLGSTCKASSIRSVSAASTTTETTLPTFDKHPELAPPLDITVNMVKCQNDTAAKRFDLTRGASIKRGRVVTVYLHQPVLYSTSAVAERLYGGIIQEIQFFPAERQAIVIFVHPDEAAAFISHAQTLRKQNPRDYRRLQIDAEWYRSTEIQAIYPTQTYILAAVIAAEASRSVLLRGLPTELGLAEFARHMKLRLSKILVKVTLVIQRNSFTRKREGNIGILDFASVRDAVEVMEAFGAKKVSDYTQCTAEWVPDPCCRLPEQKDYCQCLFCVV